MPAAGLKTIIALSFVLAVGFLLVILSCALWKVYYPLLVVATYVIAPLPNWICGRCANPDDFVESSGAGVMDLGRFCTGFMVVMGIGKHLLGPMERSTTQTLADMVRDSTTDRPRTLASHLHRRYGHVGDWWLVDLRDDHLFRHVLPGGVGILGGDGVLMCSLESAA